MTDHIVNLARIAALSWSGISIAFVSGPALLAMASQSAAMATWVGVSVCAGLALDWLVPGWIGAVARKVRRG